MKKLKKIKNSIVIVISLVLFNPMVISAVKTPTFNDGAAKEATQGFLTPMMNFALWLVPILTGLVWGIAGLAWLAKDEDDREQKPFMKTSKRIVIVGVIVECIPVLLKIFGLA